MNHQISKTEQTDTIIAIATATAEAGIGIVRMSGPQALNCAARCITDSKHAYSLNNRKPNTIRFGYVTDACGHMIDEALVSYMKAPHSYTGEDIVEINVHGGRFVLDKVLKTLLSVNQDYLRLADPGEFTKRAFLNGKMDLSQAEAVQDLISAESDFALNNALRQLTGDLKRHILELREKILHETAFLEAALDDPENYDLDEYPKKLEPVLREVIDELSTMIDSAEDGRILKEGIRATIVGRPNVGKSTLLNLLSGTNRAIVTDIPGTTRDVLSEHIRIGDLVLLLSDTAGIHTTEDTVEKIGVERALQQAKEADLILAVLDQHEVLQHIFSFSTQGRPHHTDKTEEQSDVTKIGLQDILSAFLGNEIAALTHQKKFLILLNKEDLLSATEVNIVPEILSRAVLNENLTETVKILSTSFLTNLHTQDGSDVFKSMLYEMFLKDSLVNHNEYVLTNLRHVQALEDARASLYLALNTIGEGASEDLLTVDLMDAYSLLSTIIGENVEDDLADKIFNDFCMGK